MTSPLQEMVELLRCPVCRNALTSDGRVLMCSARHTFDIAREGYVNLTSAAAARLASDTRPMVDARRRILNSGLYEPITDALEVAAGEALGGRSGTAIDLGCGPGHYLAKVASALGPVNALGIDLSKEAVRAATREFSDGAFVVGDVSQEISVADDAFDLGLSVFAPRAVAEWRRLLRPGGTMVVAMAGRDHLAQLIERFDLMKVGADKHERLLDQLRDNAFTIDSVERITYPMAAMAEQVRDLIVMGPNYWHTEAGTLETEAMEVTIDVTLTTASLRA